MPRPRKRNNTFADLLAAEKHFDRAYANALSVAPQAPGSTTPAIDPNHGRSVEERYNVLRARVRKRLAERFIEGEEGQRKYIEGSIYDVIGVYPIKGDMLDWDHEVRNAHAKLDGKTRLKLMTLLAKKLKVRT